MNEKKGTFDVFWMLSVVSLIIFGTLLYFDIFNSVKNVDNISYQLSDGGILFYVLWVCLSLILILEQKNHRIIYVWLFGMAIFALLLIFLDGTFSPIDEGAHLDMIHYISVNHRYPTMYETIDGEYLSKIVGYPCASFVRYEGVQMPLYYVIMGIITFAFPENISIIYFLRVIGLLCLFLVIFIAKKTLKLLENNGYISNTRYTNLIVLLIAGNPGIIIRFTRISNESLAVLLATYISYLAVRLFVEGYSDKLVVIGSVLSIALYYTKSTGMFVVGAIWFFLVYYKKWKPLVISVGAYGLAAIPWMIRCKRLYGTLTGLNEHMNFVLPIVNPDRVGYNLVVGIFKIFTSAFFLPAESGTQSPLITYIHDFVGILFILIFLITFISVLPKVFCFIKSKFAFVYTKEEKMDVLSIWSVILIAVDLLMLAYSTYTTQIDTMMGRYIYFLTIPLCVLISKFLNDVNIHRQIAIIMLLFYSVTFINVTVSYVNSVGEQRGYWMQTKEDAIYFRQDNKFYQMNENLNI